MAGLRQGGAVFLILLLGSVAAPAAGQPPPAAGGLYDRPMLALDPGMHTAIIKHAAADRTGNWAVTGSHDKTVRVWSLAEGALARTLWIPAGPGNIGKI